MDRFAILLADLGELIQVPLHPDSNRGCQLSINGQIHIYLKEDENKDRILMATFIAEIPAGKFREKILTEALKENHLFPRIGTFSYSERNNQLALFTFVTMVGLRGDIMADLIEAFIDKAFSWKTGIETGQLPQRGQILHKTGPSIFDIK